MADALVKEYGWDFLGGQWLEYTCSNSSATFYCQVDGLLFFDSVKRLIVLEVKYTHSIRAWWQLRHKYLPVLAKAFPHYTLSPCEICKVFDPTEPFPEEIEFHANLQSCPSNKFSVHIFGGLSPRALGAGEGAEEGAAPI